MMGEVAAVLGKLGALPIGSSEYAEPVLNVHGEGWGFQTTSAWRVLGDRGAFAFSWCTAGASELVAGLVGLSIVGVTAQGRMMPDDPCSRRSDGLSIEVFSDDAVDPWVLRLPGIAFVGSPSDLSRS